MFTDFEAANITIYPHNTTVSGTDKLTETPEITAETVGVQKVKSASVAASLSCRL
jgi:hypothetical protein